VENYLYVDLFARFEERVLPHNVFLFVSDLLLEMTFVGDLFIRQFS
jgi:hypothetical protein